MPVTLPGPARTTLASTDRKIHYLGAARSKTSALVVERRSTTPLLRPAAKAGSSPLLVTRRQLLPLFRVLVWCGVSLLMLGGMAVVLMTLGEITRRVKALGEGDLSFVNDDR